MRKLDQMAIEHLGIPGAVLMENAGRGTVEHMEQHFGSLAGQHVLIFVGPGNNGGDGSVIARTVVNKKAIPHVFFLTAPENLTGDALLNYQIIKKMGVACTMLQGEADVDAAKQYIHSAISHLNIHSIVDALFGIGLTRDVGGRFKKAIELINILKDTYNLPVVTADIPSGIHSDTGKVMGVSVAADVTVTYGYYKPGHFHHGSQHVGIVELVDIGIPELLQQKIQPDGYALTPTSLPQLAQKPLDGHKGTNGHLLILAGSTGKTGAAMLSAKGALHSGCGLVTLGVPSDLNALFEISLPEAMTVPLQHSQGFLHAHDYEALLSLINGKECVVIGPGMGNDPATATLVQKIYRDVALPMVVDADAINILAAQSETIRSPGGPRIFTPHPGEMARLLGVTPQEIQADRLKAAQWLTKESLPYPVITILKGAGTVVASNTRQWCINTT
ncbi:MAG: bifunctional ADP-dependent NAD(P)H-hydrate dehydratase/NAD(P)H-hydrate epimerase, partial [Desulfobulbus propionicus]